MKISTRRITPVSVTKFGKWKVVSGKSIFPPGFPFVGGPVDIIKV